LKTLPTLEAVQKELGEVKKAVEVCHNLIHLDVNFVEFINWKQVHESELVHELALKRVEAEKAEKARVAEAVSAAQVCCLPSSQASNSQNFPCTEVQCSKNLRPSEFPSSPCFTGFG